MNIHAALGNTDPEVREELLDDADFIAAMNELLASQRQVHLPKVATILENTK